MTDKTVRAFGLSMALMVLLFVIAASAFYFAKKPSDAIMLIRQAAVDARFAAAEARVAVNEDRLAAASFQKELEELKAHVIILTEQLNDK